MQYSITMGCPPSRRLLMFICSPRGLPCGEYSKVEDRLASNLGRMPVLATPEGSVGQSDAINYYVAAQEGFLGEGHLQVHSAACTAKPRKSILC